MRRHARRKSWPALIGAVLGLAVAAAPAKANDPLFVFIPPPPPPAPQNIPPPTGRFNGPCGLAVDSSANFYVSDYYHHAIDVFTPAAGYVTQLANVDPLGGPCGIALDSSNRLYVNNYHRNVTKYNASPSFGAGTVFPLPAEDTEHHLPTGVAVNSETSTVYVNNRTYISVYDLAGNPIMDGLEPLKIGQGTLGDGYGLAVSTFDGSESIPSTKGRLYVADASTDTVKVYDPTVDKVNPVGEIKDPFGKSFVSLRDSAIAIDRVTGEIYFADNLQPSYTEKPQAVIYVYRANNTWRGYLKYKIIDALPPGLAVNNFPSLTQGRVYVTSGNTHQAGIYAYPPGAATTAAPLPPSLGLAVRVNGSGQGTITSSLGGVECAGTCEAEIRAGVEVSLTATPDSGSAFTGWLGECSGTQPSCTVRMDGAAAVGANFAELPSGPPAAASSSASSVTPRQQSASRRKARCRAAKRRYRSAHPRRACRRHRSTRRR